MMTTGIWLIAFLLKIKDLNHCDLLKKVLFKLIDSS